MQQPVTEMGLDIAETLDLLCRRYKITQKELGQHLLTHEQTISNWINSKQEPPAYLLRALKDVEQDLIKG